MLISILFFAGIGAVTGIILTVSGKIFRVEIDDTVERLVGVLPGINCGACGFANCERYAEAIVQEGVAANQCKPGGVEAASKVGEILGKEVAAPEPEAAYVHCMGTCKAKYKYKGTKSCSASELYYNGKENCRFACTGLGDCVKVCPERAITIKNRRAVIAHNKCNACGLCIKVCPKNIIMLQKTQQAVQVTCCSKNTGKITKSVCSSGCVGCKICEKRCPKNAITIRDNLAVINGDLCDNCGICANACPTKCIRFRLECD